MPLTEVTPLTVVQNLLELARQLAELSAGLGDLEQRAVHAREDYITAHATAFLTAEGAMELRKQQALLDTSTERLAAETADALVRQRREQIRAINTRIEVGRSAAAALRAEIQLERST